MSDTSLTLPPINTGDAPQATAVDEREDFSALDQAGRAVLLGSIVVVALCGIVYELIIGSVSSYLLGNSVYQFSITIGFFMFAMGVGSYLSQHIRERLIYNFILVEICLAVVGGLCSIVLFLTFPFSPAMYRTVMLGFIIVIGALVGLEIPLLTRILAQIGGTRRSIAKVMSLDYFGALIGSVAFPLMLLPSLGLVRASFAIGLANVLVALMTMHFLRNHLPNVKRLAAIAGVILFGLTALVMMSSRINAFAQQHLYFDDIIWKKQTPYQSLVMTQNWKQQDLRLFIDGHLQFAQSDEHRYHEALVHPVMSFPGAKENILILGGGDGLAVRELLKYDMIERIDLVDLDPAITDLAQTFPQLVKLNGDSFADPRVHIHNADAFVFIKDAAHRYDRVIIDMPDPHDEAISKLYSVEFYAMIKKKLRDGGYVVTQSSSPFFARRTFWSVNDTMAAAFGATQSYNLPIPSFGVWGFHLAAENDAAFTAPSTIAVETKFLTDDVMKAAKVFSKDIGPSGAPAVNSIFEPRLYQLYLQDMRGKVS